MANTPYYTKAETDAISALLRRDYNYGNIQFQGSISAGTYASKTAGWYIADGTGNYIMGATTIAVDVSDTLTIIIVPTVINDSSKVEVPLTIVVENTIIDGNLNAVSGNAVFDGLALKANQTYVDDVTSSIIVNSRKKIYTKSILNQINPADDERVLKLENKRIGVVLGAYAIVDAVGFYCLAIPREVFTEEFKYLMFPSMSTADNGSKQLICTDENFNLIASTSSQTMPSKTINDNASIAYVVLGYEDTVLPNIQVVGLNYKTNNVFKSFLNNNIFERSANLLDFDNLSPLALNDTGVIVYNASFKTTSFIEITNINDTFYSNLSSSVFYALFDVDFNWLVGGTSSLKEFKPTDVNASAKYVLFGSNTGLLNDNTWIAKSNIGKYVPFYVLKEKFLKPNERLVLSQNFMRFTEDVNNSYYTKISMIVDNTNILKYKGVNLMKITGTSFYSYLQSNFEGLSYAPFTVGKKYILSCFVTNLSKDETFIWMWDLANTSSNGHGGRLINGEVRRIWKLCYATATNKLADLKNPTLTLETSTGSSIRWLSSNSTTRTLDLRVGGFQIEQIDDDNYVNGIAIIGDSTMQGSAGSVDLVASSEISRYLEGLLNCNVFNRAVGGQRTDQMDLRWSTDITPLAPNCKYAIIQGGINDLTQSRALVDIQSSIQSMYDKAITDGMIPLLMTCTPSVGIVSAGTESDRVALNAWIKNTFPIVFDIASIIENPTNIQEINPIFSSDGTHYGIAAKRAIANSIVKWDGWDFLQPKDYQQVLATTPTIEYLKNRKIGEIELLKPISVFSESNNVNAFNRRQLI